MDCNVYYMYFQDFLLKSIAIWSGSQEATSRAPGPGNVWAVRPELSLVFPAVAEVCPGDGEISQATDGNQR